MFLLPCADQLLITSTLLFVHSSVVLKLMIHSLINMFPSLDALRHPSAQMSAFLLLLLLTAIESDGDDDE